MSNFAFILGDWSRNIGNAFFQWGGYQVLKELFPDAEFAMIAEQPGYPSYWNPFGGNPDNYFDMASATRSDYLVLMGPLFRKETMKIWESSLRKITNQGTKLILLGVAAMDYKDSSIKLYREFLKSFPPYILLSRDRETFDCLGNLANFAYDGIDFGFFVPDYYQLSALCNHPEYIALSFDKGPEPTIEVFDKNIEIKPSEDDVIFEFNNEIWKIQNHSWRERMAKKSRYLMFLEGIIFGGNNISKIGRYEIIRTDHRPHPMIRKRTYRYPNVMVNDVPFPYFEVYGNSLLTFSNRLHACIIALGYGKNAMLFSKSPRTRLLDRLGLQDISKSPVLMNQSILNEEKQKIKDFLMNIIK